MEDMGDIPTITATMEATMEATMVITICELPPPKVRANYIK
jgi:hypothetical protein